MCCDEAGHEGKVAGSIFLAGWRIQPLAACQPLPATFHYVIVDCLRRKRGMSQGWVRKVKNQHWIASIIHHLDINHKPPSYIIVLRTSCRLKRVSIHGGRLWAFSATLGALRSTCSEWLIICCTYLDSWRETVSPCEFNLRIIILANMQQNIIKSFNPRRSKIWTGRHSISDIFMAKQERAEPYNADWPSITGFLAGITGVLKKQ